MNSELKIEQWDISRVIPYDKNPRKNKDAIAKVAASLTEYGFRQPIVVDSSGVVIVGHTRLEAARSLKYDKVPVHVAAGLNETQVKAYRLADNRTGEEATWDEKLLAAELKDLSSVEFDLNATGFDDKELSRLLAPEIDPAIADEVIPPPPNPASQIGDLWHLGRHRLLNGDSTDAAGVARLLEGCKPVLMVTDPPYGVKYDPSWRATAKAKGVVLNDDRADWREAWALYKGPAAYVWHGGLHAGTVAESLVSTGFEMRAQIIWVKNRPVLSRGHYHWQHEPCWYAVRTGSKGGYWNDDRTQTTTWRMKDTVKRPEDYVYDPSESTVWEIEHMVSETGHGTQKPVECMRRPMLNNSKLGETVYDPFLGSGTTIIAAEMCGRAARGVELSPAYADVIIQRFQKFSGVDAIHAETGKTYAQIHAERVG